MSFYHRPRRLLLDGGGGRNDYSRAASFDTNMLIILAALLCALICALGINSIVRCMLRCATRMNPAADETMLQRKGLRKAALRQIPVAVYGAEQGVGPTDCPICLGEFSGGDKIRVLPKCHHCFHVKCVDVWLVSHSSCPTCRQSLAEDHGGEVVAEGSGRPSGHVDTTPGAEEASSLFSAQKLKFLLNFSSSFPILLSCRWRRRLRRWRRRRTRV